MKQARTGIGTAVIVGLAVAGLVAPAAQGRPLGGGYVTGAYGAPRAIGLGPQTSGVSQQQLQQRVGTSFTTSAYGAPRAIGLGPRTSGETTAASAAVTTSGDNFDWQDAGIGAATVCVVSILLIGSLIVVRRRETRVAL